MEEFYVIKPPSEVTGYRGKIKTIDKAKEFAMARAEQFGTTQYVLKVIGVATPTEARWEE